MFMVVQRAAVLTTVLWYAFAPLGHAAICSARPAALHYEVLVDDLNWAYAALKERRSIIQATAPQAGCSISTLDSVVLSTLPSYVDGTQSGGGSFDSWFAADSNRMTFPVWTSSNLYYHLNLGKMENGSFHWSNQFPDGSYAWRIDENDAIERRQALGALVWTGWNGAPSDDTNYVGGLADITGLYGGVGNGSSFISSKGDALSEWARWNSSASWPYAYQVNGSISSSTNFGPELTDPTLGYAWSAGWSYGPCGYENYCDVALSQQIRNSGIEYDCYPFTDEQEVECDWDEVCDEPYMPAVYWHKLIRGGGWDCAAGLQFETNLYATTFRRQSSPILFAGIAAGYSCVNEVYVRGKAYMASQPNHLTLESGMHSIQIGVFSRYKADAVAPQNENFYLFDDLVRDDAPYRFTTEQEKAWEIDGALLLQKWDVPGGFGYVD